MPKERTFQFKTASLDSGLRLDQVLASHLPELSRSFITKLIREDGVLVDGFKKKPGYRTRAGDEIRGKIVAPEPVACQPEPIDLDVLFEDTHLIAINKSPGIVVHPAPGHESGTLVNALLHHCRDLSGIGGVLRPGIVHRLDRDTSGVLVVAKNDAAHRHLAEQFKSRIVKKRYVGLVFGRPRENSGIVTLPIGRHPVDRKRMSTVSHAGRAAETHWHCKEHFPGLSLLEFNLKTGRTHQIRVHSAALGHPIVGDLVYAGRKSGHFLPPAPLAVVRSVKRQLLHAWRLSLLHPATGRQLKFEAPIPADMTTTLTQLRAIELQTPQTK